MPSEPPTGQQLYHGETLAPVVATQVVATAIFGIYAAQIGLYSAGLIELVAALIGDLVVLGALLVYVRWRRLGRAHLGVRRAAGAYMAAAVLIGLSAWYVNLRIVNAIQPPGDTSALEAIIEQTPFLTTVLAIAVLPAIVEELVFRGIFARALATRFSRVLAIGVSSTVFALYHLQPAQIISTFGLGLALAYLTLRAGSVIPAMLAHFINNTFVLVVSRDEVPGLSPWMAAHGGIMLVASAALLAAGLALTAKGPA